MAKNERSSNQNRSKPPNCPLKESASRSQRRKLDKCPWLSWTQLSRPVQTLRSKSQALKKKITWTLFNWQIRSNTIRFQSKNRNICHSDGRTSQIPTSNPQNQLMEETVRKSLRNHTEQHPENIIFFPSEETRNKIRKLPSNKAPGPNGITNSALKRSYKKVIIQLTNIFNGCIRA